MTPLSLSDLAGNDYRTEVYQREDGLWDWRMTAPNGQIVATSGGQGYTEKNDAHEGLDRVVEHLGR